MRFPCCICGEMVIQNPFQDLCPDCEDRLEETPWPEKTLSLSLFQEREISNEVSQKSLQMHGGA